MNGYQTFWMNYIKIISTSIGAKEYKKLILEILLLSPLWSTVHCTMFKKINTYLLLHWEEAISMPSKLTSANGEPEAKMALPLVHL